ncbi:hypothetical protein BDZ89DRAFT_1157548 [Hymenopellis radicata]|nr:hypothetical protein BDZ89DRAFT_1157548 [Hymenopellis radicata]
MSSQDFIRALKASSDPPVANGPFKIEIARAGWQNSGLYVLRKEELIADWILTQFHKDKASVLDVRYWELLSDVLSSPQVPLKTWLPSMLNRISVATIVVSLLSSLNTLENERQTALSISASKCLSILWPLSVRKIGVDALLECLGAFLSAVNNNDLDESALQIGTWIANSFRLSLSNSSNKKKIYTAFTQTYLVEWTLCVQKDLVVDKLYDAGVEILFNLDILRQLNENDTSLFDSFQAAPLFVLSRLFLSFVLATKRLRGALFGQSSSQQSIGGLDDVRAAATRFYVSSQRLVESKNMGTESWRAQLDLLRVVKDQALFTGQQELQDAFRVIIDYAIKALKNYSIAGVVFEPPSEPILMISQENQQLEASLAAEMMSVIASIEYDAISPLLSRTLFRVLLIPSTEASYGALLENLLEYHSKTRTVNSLLEIILRDMPLPDLITPHEDATEVYTTVMSSPLMRPAFLDRLRTAPKLSLHPRKSDEATASQDALTSYMKALKKTAATDIGSDSVHASESSGVTLSLTCRIAGVVLVSIEHENLAPEVWRRFRSLDLPEPKLTARLLEFITEKNRCVVFTELTFEIFRHLLECLSRSTSEVTDGFVDRLMAYLQHLADDTSRKANTQVLLYTIVERWLPTIDYKATRAQVDALIHVLIEHNDALSSNLPLRYCLSSAEFWELEQVRECLLAYVDTATAAFQTDVGRVDTNQLDKAINIFELLLLFPPDYFPRQLNLNLSKRALVVDAAITNCREKEFRCEALTVLRTFSQRILSHLDTDDRSQAYQLLEYLMTTQTADEHLIAATLDLVELHVAALLKSDVISGFQQLLTSFRNIDADSFLRRNLRARCLESTIGILTKNQKLHRFSDSVQAEIQSLHRHLIDLLEPRMVAILSSSFATLSSRETVGCLHGWRHILSLGRWLAVGLANVHGPKLCLLASQSTMVLDPELVDVIFYVFKEECLCVEALPRAHLLDILTQAYISLSDHGTDAVDAIVSEVFRNLTADEFTRMTKTLESRFSEEFPAFQRTVVLATLLLQEAPKDTLHVSQTFTTLCLTMFGGGGAFVTPSVRPHVFRFILQRCRDRAATLRSLDVNAIWSIIAKFLSNTTSHEDHTSPRVFHDIIAASQPSFTLRNLLGLMRHPKPQLGGKQTCLISDSFPAWIQIREPLGTEEAKAMSRLLETLNSKTIVKSYSSSKDSSKAESLAKPFSKHSAFVLTAFIEAASDPLCVVPTNTRKELQPGLFALCDMLNEHDRDAMMLSSLDASGKVIMKSLWKDYEKQRYVGRG